MTLSELKKLIETEVSAAVSKPMQETLSEPMREPQVIHPKRPVYRPVLKTEEEIDTALFYGGTKPD